MKAGLRDIFAGAILGLALTMVSVAAHAVPFGMAGLDADDWTQIPDPASGGLFGSGGNGLFANGGTLTLAVKEAGFDHEFGITAGDLTGFQVLVDDDGFSGPIAVEFTPESAGPFLFLARNASGGALSGQFAASDGRRSDGRLDLAVFFNNINPHHFLFFFDDGGGGDDNDFNDMIIFATAAATVVPEPATLGLLGAGLIGLGFLAWRRKA